MSKENGLSDSASLAVEKQERMDRVLAELARKEGLTPRRVEVLAPWLVEELGVANAQGVCDLIRNTLEDLDFSSQYRPTILYRGESNRRALRNAFGGEGLPKMLAERRRQEAQARGVTHVAIARREGNARRLLAEVLLRIADEKQGDQVLQK